MCLYFDFLLIFLFLFNYFVRLLINVGIDVSDNINYIEKIKWIFSLGKFIEYLNLRCIRVVK